MPHRVTHMLHMSSDQIRLSGQLFQSQHRNHRLPGGKVMTTRRHFLKAGASAAATGIVFCGCGLLHGAHAQQPVRQTLPVMVGGKRVKTTDVHTHCQFREAGALLAGAAAVKTPALLIDGRPATDVTAAAYIEIDKRLAAMDAQAVDMEVLSINPFLYGSESDL